jgi:hypothetical protein
MTHTSSVCPPTKQEEDVLAQRLADRQATQEAMNFTMRMCDPAEEREAAEAMQDVTYLAFTVAKDAYSKINPTQASDGDEWDTAMANAQTALDKARADWFDARVALNVANGLR